MKNKILILIFLILVISPIFTFAESSIGVITDIKVLDIELTSEEVSEMILNNAYNGLDVRKEIIEEDINGIIEITTIKQPLMRIKYSNGATTQRTIVHTWGERRSSKSDPSKTATLYVTSVFDIMDYDNNEYVRVVEGRHSVFMHDSSFRPKSTTGTVGQAGPGARDKNGNIVPVTPEYKDFSRSYPIPGQSYTESIATTKYFLDDSYSEIGTTATVTLERISTGGSIITIKVSANYWNWLLKLTIEYNQGLFWNLMLYKFNVLIG